MNTEFPIEQATRADAAEILALQKLAYQSEAAIWNDYGIPPLVETLEAITARFDDHVFLKMVNGGAIIGSLRASQDAEGTCSVGRVIVRPESSESRVRNPVTAGNSKTMFSTAKRFELFTGTKSARNLYLYQKLGYRPFREDALNERVTLVYLEKLPQKECKL
jgi:hypothetical protein